MLRFFKMADRSVLVLVLCVGYCVAYSFMEDELEREGPIWPTEFHVKAEKLDLNSGIVEVMEIWSSATYNRSRMDFYNGLVKTYHYWETEDESGTIYNFIPVSTEEYKNKITCSMSGADSDESNDLLPKVEPYKFIGEEEINGIQVEKWKYEMLSDKKKWLERTLYTYPSGDFDVPVRFEARNYFTPKGALSSHSIINYYGYDPTVEEKVLDAGDTDDCLYMVGKDFPADVKHLHPAKESDVNTAFHSFKKHHGKNYDSEDEHELRKAIFQENWEMITLHNRHNPGYKMELNRFADHTEEDMFHYTGLLPSQSMPGTHPFPHSDEEVRNLAEDLPEDYDMRLEGFITPIKDQAQCGSCWAFSSTAAIEGAVARSNGRRLVDLSEQSLVDCAWGLGCQGCDGGIMELAFHYILKHGIPMEYEYGSYLEQDGLCHLENMTTTVHIKGFGKSTPLNPQAMRVALYNYGPVAVSIYFNKKMRFYASGIFYDPECNYGHPNHGVVVVGYGTRDGAAYWIVKNSHGTAWGQAGYILISATLNNCFVLSDPFYPIV